MSRRPREKVVDRDLGWRDILENAKALAKGASVKVGVLGDPERGGLHHVDAATGKASALTVAEAAVVNEYGTEDGTIPSRPAHRMTFERRQEEIERQGRAAVEGVVLDGTMTAEQALNLMGMSHAAAIKSTIVSGAGVPPPNAPSTLARKEAAGDWNRRGEAQRAGEGPRTLVDTGVTVNAISWAVELDGAEGKAQFLTGDNGRGKR